MGWEEIHWWLEEGERVRARQMIEAAKCAAFPHMSEEVRESFMATLLHASRTPEEREAAERAKQEEVQDNWSMLRRMFGGKR